MFPLKRYAELLLLVSDVLNSAPKDSSKHHKIAEDGYNRGRDWLVERATSVSHYGGIWWKAEVEWNESDLLLPGKEGEI